MTRLFLDRIINVDDIIELSEEDSRYISQVLRMREGEEIIIVDKDQNDVVCEIEKVEKKSVSVKAVSKKKNSSESPVIITLYQSVSKGERMDLTIQKSVELGVSYITPVISDRTIVKKSAIDESKISRWQKIALEAARQSGRAKVPVINPVMKFDKALTDASEKDLAIIPWEDEKGTTLKEVIPADMPKTIGVIIGPEGGFSEEEVSLAKTNNVKPVTLGPRILRTETAGPAVLAMLTYATEM